MSIVDKALWVIERNSSGELNLPAVERAELDGVLHKLVNALEGEGALLLSHPVGGDEVWEHATRRLSRGALVERFAG